MPPLLSLVLALTAFLLAPADARADEVVAWRRPQVVLLDGPGETVGHRVPREMLPPLPLPIRRVEANRVLVVEDPRTRKLYFIPATEVRTSLATPQGVRAPTTPCQTTGNSAFGRPC
ncbi:hypothetical protein E0493_10655 [Roseomonas sp. M0104]|uniref:DUF1236 domain-containing protein n=1 Tax=Teichococcus coralli TaxID=2545983 RepID=A0A845BK58_9PROT|nr:hypothetical protein [Pseudoroseomonas coralli]MXP63809.1 hypothetical protein [Pseudoroseomonas coralli]